MYSYTFIKVRKITNLFRKKENSLGHLNFALYIILACPIEFAQLPFFFDVIHL